MIYGVSRRTIYKWIERYNRLGPDGLKEFSRAPMNHPNQIDEEIIDRLVKAKLNAYELGSREAVRLLKRYASPRSNGPLSVRQKNGSKDGALSRSGGCARVPRNIVSLFWPATLPNKVWSADYKGQFKTGDGRWCYPLTITDNMSRYLLACKGLYSPCHVDTQPWFEWVFREFGLPEAIRTDNGTPFAGRGVTGLSRLSVWWIKLGIRPERIESGKPQQNGRHERMHRTLKQDTAKPPKADMDRQQCRFDEFRHEYNYDRPHEALDKKTPVSVYEPSPRRFPRKASRTRVRSRYRGPNGPR